MLRQLLSFALASSVAAGALADLVAPPPPPELRPVLGQVENPRYSIPALIERHRVTHFQCTPSQARVLLVDEAGRKALSSLDMLMLGGEALPAELAEELCALVSGQVFNLYGPTETTVWSTFARVEAGRLVSIGRPIAHHQALAFLIELIALKGRDRLTGERLHSVLKY